MKPYGEFRRKIMIMGEAPGETEDRAGKPFQGKTGRLLQRTCEKLGVDLFKDCVVINAVHCRPVSKDKENRAPTNFEIECCQRTTLSYIQQYHPHVILALGNSAVYSLLKNHWLRDIGGITKWRGWTIPDTKYNAWVCPTFHPSHVERADGTEVTTIWEQDLRRAFSCTDTPLLRYKEPTIEIIEDLSPLKSIPRGSTIAFDYETTGRKPHASGHRIVSCAVADTETHAWAFLMPQSRAARAPLIELLGDKDIKKIAQNMKFEHAWSAERLRVEVKGWEWDTMLMTHILDNRTGITGLKFQTYVQFGVSDYSSEVDTYLKDADTKDGNGFNKIDKLLEKPGGKRTLLTYNAWDALWELRLANVQRSPILPF
jgi:uracil-DNA glycosylase family 4